MLRRFRRWFFADLYKELKLMTDLVSDALDGLQIAVSDVSSEIKTLADSIVAYHNGGDTTAVQAQADRIKGLAASLEQAVADAKTEVAGPDTTSGSGDDTTTGSGSDTTIGSGEDSTSGGADTSAGDTTASGLGEDTTAGADAV